MPEPLATSVRPEHPGTRLLGPVDPHADIEVTVYLRGRGDVSETASALGQQAPPQRRRYALEDLEEEFGATEADIALASRVFTDHDLQIGSVNRAARSIAVSGTVADVLAVFPVSLWHGVDESGGFRARVGPIEVHPDLEGVVEAVLGMDDRLVPQPYRRSHKKNVVPSHKKNVVPSHRKNVVPSHKKRVVPSHVVPAQASAAESRPGGVPSHVVPSHIFPSVAQREEPRRPHWPAEIAEAYDFPTHYDGTGQQIAVLAFSGGTEAGDAVFGGYDADLLEEYFRDHANVRRRGPVREVVLRGAGNLPGPGDGPRDVTDEVMLDLQLAGALAPGAELVVYFSEPTEQGFVDALHEIVQGEQEPPSVLCICYGAPEDADFGYRWTEMGIHLADRALATAALRGTTVCCSCGDNGAEGAPFSTRVLADFPASSPWVLSCGGTRLAWEDGSIRDEVVWNDGEGASGGGISRVFRRPPWQDAAGVPIAVGSRRHEGRGVPDVAAVADPATGVRVFDAQGRLVVTGGTSVAAPVWAALVARMNQALGASGPLGYVTPYLYRLHGSGAFRDVVSGDNGAYLAGPGWDACTGLGTPVAGRLLAKLREWCGVGARK
jgi:kumamolisin